MDKETARRELTWRKCGQSIASFQAGPLLWLTRFTETEDPHWLSKGTEPVAPFPAKEYFRVVMHYLLTKPKVFLPKTREMMTSWLVCGYVAWQIQWFPQVHWVLQSQKENKANELVEYVRILHRRQQPWMRDRVKIVADKASEITLSNGATVTGIPQGEGQIRSYHPTGYVMDETSHLAEAEQCYAVALPVARQIIGISSVAPGWFATQCDL